MLALHLHTMMYSSITCLTIIFLGLAVFGALQTVGSTAAEPVKEPPQNKKPAGPIVDASDTGVHFLAVVLLYRNGGAQMDEWLDHYVDEGVNHFVFVDDKSNDGYTPPKSHRGCPIEYTTTASILDKLLARDADRTDPTRISQREALLGGLTLLAGKAVWVMIVDQDEFVTAKRDVESTLANELKTTFSGSDAVLFPWILMGFKPKGPSSQ